jgi:hypothetical protein
LAIDDVATFTGSVEVYYCRLLMTSTKFNEVL